jgi:quinol monooxygenase YgiN
MYARTTTVMADTMRMDAGIADVRDNVMPAVLEMDGCTGLSMLCDRASGRCIVTTAWATEDAISASRERVMQLRERAANAFGSRDTQVQEWEIAVLHRLHPATDDSCARVSWSRIDPARAEEALGAFSSTIVPAMDDLAGFCSMSLLVDRENGVGSLTTVYADRAAMDATKDQMTQMRDDFAGRMGITIDEEAEFDVAIHHLRVPELV